MKTLYATAGSTENPVSSTVELNNYGENDGLSPKMARAAARIAFGHTHGISVTDGKMTYRLTGNRCRRVTSRS